MAAAKNDSCSAPKAPGYRSLTQPSGSVLPLQRSMLGDIPVRRQPDWDAPSRGAGSACVVTRRAGDTAVSLAADGSTRVTTISVLTSKSSVWDVKAPFQNKAQLVSISLGKKKSTEAEGGEK